MSVITKEELYDKLVKWIEEKQGYLIESTAQLLRFRTISGGKTDTEINQYEKGISECLAYLEKMANNFGLNFVNLDKKVCYIEQPEGEEIVAIPVHIDVVPTGDGWRYPPFSGVIARGKVWGRGAQDDKGPIMECLFGLYALKELGLKFNKKIRIVIGTKEEIGDWSDLHYYIEKFGAPAFGFTPDCLFPIINGEKGMLNLKICLDNQNKKEYTEEIEFLSLMGGDRANIVPDNSVLSLLLPSKNTDESISKIEEEIKSFLANNQKSHILIPIDTNKTDEETGRKIAEITFKGEPAHGSIPWHGHNAIADSLKFIMNLKNLPQEIKVYTEFLYKSTLDFNGKGLNIYKLHDFIGPTSVNLGVIHLNRKEGLATINIRQPIGLTIPEIKEKIQQVITPVKSESGVNIYLRHDGGGVEALYVDPNKYPFYFEAMETAYKRVTNLKPELQSIGGTTFAKAFPNTVVFGPVILQGEEKEMAHMKDECVSINEIIRNTKIYAYALGLMCTEIAE